jgi:hypothetical protein
MELNLPQWLNVTGLTLDAVGAFFLVRGLWVSLRTAESLSGAYLGSSQPAQTCSDLNAIGKDRLRQSQNAKIGFVFLLFGFALQAASTIATDKAAVPDASSEVEEALPATLGLVGLWHMEGEYYRETLVIQDSTYHYVRYKPHEDHHPLLGHAEMGSWWITEDGGIKLNTTSLHKDGKWHRHQYADDSNPLLNTFFFSIRGQELTLVGQLFYDIRSFRRM